MESRSIVVKAKPTYSEFLSSEKGSVIWAEPNSRSYSKQNIWLGHSSSSIRKQKRRTEQNKKGWGRVEV